MMDNINWFDILLAFFVNMVVYFWGFRDGRRKAMVTASRIFHDTLEAHGMKVVNKRGQDVNVRLGG